MTRRETLAFAVSADSLSHIAARLADIARSEAKGLDMGTDMAESLTDLAMVVASNPLLAGAVGDFLAYVALDAEDVAAD